MRTTPRCYQLLAHNVKSVTAPQPVVAYDKSMTVLHESDTFDISRHTAHRFERLQALQSQGPEAMRMLARIAWHAIDAKERDELITESVQIFGSGEPERHDAFINTRLITKYLDGAEDKRHDFHEEIHTRPSGADGGVSDLPPEA